MKLDSVITEIIIDLANKHQIPSSEVHKMLEGYYRGIHHIISEGKQSTIKVDFFGKFVYSNSYKRKLDELYNIQS